MVIINRIRRAIARLFRREPTVDESRVLNALAADAISLGELLQRTPRVKLDAGEAVDLGDGDEREILAAALRAGAAQHLRAGEDLLALVERLEPSSSCSTRNRATASLTPRPSRASRPMPCAPSRKGTPGYSARTCRPTSGGSFRALPARPPRRAGTAGRPCRCGRRPGPPAAAGSPGPRRSRRPSASTRRPPLKKTPTGASARGPMRRSYRRSPSGIRTSGARDATAVARIRCRTPGGAHGCTPGNDDCESLRSDFGMSEPVRDARRRLCRCGRMSACRSRSTKRARWN